MSKYTLENIYDQEDLRQINPCHNNGCNSQIFCSLTSFVLIQDPKLCTVYNSKFHELWCKTGVIKVNRSTPKAQVSLYRLM